MLFIPKVEFSATFRHVWSSQSWCFARPKIGLWACVQWVPKQPQMRAVRVQNLPASLYKHSELLFYATIHISSDFGHVSNSNHSAVAAALLCSWRCTGRLRRFRFSETVARAVVLASRQPCASWCASARKESDGAIGVVPNC